MNSDGYSSFPLPLKLIRSKKLEKTRNLCPSTYHSTSTIEKCRNKCCKMSIIIKINRVDDYFFISSRGGNQFHCFHPKLSQMEISQYKTTAAHSAILLYNQLQAVHTPTPIIRQVITNDKKSY